MSFVVYTVDETVRKYLVYEAYEPPYNGPVWKAVDADGKHGLMVGKAPESRVYSWYAESAEAALAQAEPPKAGG